MPPKNYYDYYDYNDEQSILDEELTIKELEEALTSFADNKSPGLDGFTKNFSKLF